MPRPSEISHPEGLTFSGLGGPQPARWFGPANAACVVGIAPALGLRATWYAPFAQALVDAGEGRVAVVTADLPGHGESPLRAGRARDWGYGDVVAHLGALRAAARSRGGRFAWVGHSLGGQCALFDAEDADAVVLIASGTPYHAAWGGLAGARILALTQLGALIAQALGHFPGERLGFGGREARTLIAQWAHAARRGDYHFAGFDGEASLARARAPVHAVVVEGDPWAPVTAVDHTLARMPGAAVTTEVWPRAEQGAMARGNPHNRWPREPAWPAARVVARLAAWGVLERGA